MISVTSLNEGSTNVRLQFNSKEEFHNNFSALIKSLLLDEVITTTDIFASLFSAFVGVNKFEEFKEACVTGISITQEDIDNFLEGVSEDE